MGDRVVPRAEDGLAPDRRLAALVSGGLAALALAGCAGGTYSEVAFHNDLGRRVRIGYCRDGACRQVRWWIAIDPGQRATEEIRSDGKATRRFLVEVPPETVYGCFAFQFAERRPPSTVQLSAARGCGSGR